MWSAREMLLFSPSYPQSFREESVCLCAFVYSESVNLFKNFYLQKAIFSKLSCILKQIVINITTKLRMFKLCKLLVKYLKMLNLFSPF